MPRRRCLLTHNQASRKKKILQELRSYWKLKMKNAMHYKTDKCNHDNWRKSDDVDVNRHEWSFAKAAALK